MYKWPERRTENCYRRQSDMHKLITLFVTLSALLIAFGAGCSDNDRSSNQDGVAADSSLKPDSEVQGARIHLFEGNRVTTEVLADKIMKYEAIDSTMAYGLDIDSYDSLGNVSSHVVGDSGVIRQSDGRFTIFGNVVVTTSDSMRLETDYLHWHSKTDRIFTDAYVVIETPDEIVRGWGMEANQDLKRYKILHQVSGEIQDTEKLKPEPGENSEN